MQVDSNPFIKPSELCEDEDEPITFSQNPSCGQLRKIDLTHTDDDPDT